MHILVYANTEKGPVRPVFDQTIRFFEEQGVEWFVSDEIAQNYDCLNRAVKASDWEKIDLAISLGGDGTLLRAARQNALRSIPVCGVNMGRLGFLTEVEVPDLRPCLELLVQGHYFIEKRLMLDVFVRKLDQEEVWMGTALNDAVVAKSPAAKLLRLRLYVHGELTARYAADGMIVATPTGSTGYALSAGGPIVHPKLPVIVVTPICAHSLEWRPLIIGQEEEVRIELASSGQALLTLDGQDMGLLEPDQIVTVRRSPYIAQFIRFHHNRYYSNLKQKFNRGEENELS